jgi:DNA-binding PadR family transcriptional regulator
MRQHHHHHDHQHDHAEGHLRQHRGHREGEEHGGRRFRRGPGGGFGGFGPPFGGPGFGGPGFGGHGFGPRGPRGGRARRGDVRAAILSLLGDGPSNGYGLIRGIADRTEGSWRPSPGSVYPTLAQLVDEGLIEPVAGEGSRSDYQLTDAGREYVTAHSDEIAAAWSSPAAAGPGEFGDLFEATGKLLGVVRQFATDASAEQRERAVAKIDGLRRELYAILAE